MPSTSAAATRLLLFAEDRGPSGPQAVKVRRYRMARLALADTARPAAAGRDARLERAHE